jgi:hypothetical protein
MRSRHRDFVSAARRRGPWLLAVFLVSAAAPLSCSLLVENRAEQCQSDADCSPITGTRCDLGTHICSSDGTTSSGGGGAGGTTATTGGSGGTTTTTTTNTDCDAGGCWACEPTNDPQFLNACTDAKCEKFDNKARCKHLTEDGGVPPLDASFD